MSLCVFSSFIIDFACLFHSEGSQKTSTKPRTWRNESAHLFCISSGGRTIHIACERDNNILKGQDLRDLLVWMLDSKGLAESPLPSQMQLLVSALGTFQTLSDSFRITKGWLICYDLLLAIACLKNPTDRLRSWQAGLKDLRCGFARRLFKNVFKNVPEWYRVNWCELIPVAFISPQGFWMLLVLIIFDMRWCHLSGHGVMLDIRWAPCSFSCLVLSRFCVLFVSGFNPFCGLASPCLTKGWWN